MAIIKLHGPRLSFPQLWEGKQVNGEGEFAYSANFLIPDGSPMIKIADAAIMEAAKEKWKDKAASIVEQLRATDKLCLHKGSTKPDYDGYPGNYFVSSRRLVKDGRPTVMAANGKTPLAQADGKPYSGCYVVAFLEVWAQNNSFGKRVNATLLGVQFLADGDAFSSGAPPAKPEMFEDLSAGADAGDIA